MPDEDEAIETGIVGRGEDRIGPVGEPHRFEVGRTLVATRAPADGNRRQIDRDDGPVEQRQQRFPAPGAVTTTVYENDRHRSR